MSAGSAIVPLTGIGGLAPPDGVTPNFTDPYSIANSLTAANMVCVALASLTTAMRLYTKFCIIKTHGWEDYAMVVAWGVFVAYCFTGFSLLKYGAGVHQWDVPITKVVHFAHGASACEILFLASITLIKLSICLQSLRIFVVNHGRAFWSIHVFIWVNTLFYVACFFLAIFQCTPRAKIWDPKKPGKCVNYKAFSLVASGFNFLSDLLMLVFTLVCIWKLKMSTRRKKGISAIFLIGTLGLVARIIRIVFGCFYLRTHDDTFVLSQIAVCSTGELAAGIIAGNLVVSPRFFSTCSTKLASIFSSFRSNSRSGERLHDASPGEASSSRVIRIRNAQGDSTVPGSYTELSDQGYKTAATYPHKPAQA